MIYILLAAVPIAIVAFFYVLGSYEPESPRGSELSWSDRESKISLAKTNQAGPQSGSLSVVSASKKPGSAIESSARDQAQGSATVSSIRPAKYGRAA